MSRPHPAWRRIAAARARQKMAERSLRRPTPEGGIDIASPLGTDTAMGPELSCVLPRFNPRETNQTEENDT